MIKNYIFDLGNVVLILNWKKVLDKYNISDEEKNLLNNVVFESDEWKYLDEGIISKSDAIKVMKKSLPEKLYNYCDDIMNTWHDGLDLNNEILDLIKEIKSKGYNTYILSNAPLDIDDYLTEKNLKKYFNGIVLSAFEKKVKPNEEIYNLILNRFNIKAEESIFIDDRLDNVQSAKNIGIDAFQFDYKDIESLKKYINRE